MATIVDGSKIAERILEELRITNYELSRRGAKPRLVVFLVGENAASSSYVRIKQKKAAEVGIEVVLKEFVEEVSQQDLIAEIKRQNLDPKTSGIIVQLPLPKHIDTQAVLGAIDPRLDVDCLTEENKTKLAKGKELFFDPPAPAAILEILDYYNIDLTKGNILLIGSGDLVGKPLSAMLLRRGVNFELANLYTENLAELTSKADIIIAGTGKPGLVRGDMVKVEAVMIDAGTTGSEEGEVVGDADFESVSKKASLITPVPGGVGPVTVAMLLRNVVKAANLGLKI